jgi:ADP-heptose:LPS heptosyltransferase
VSTREFPPTENEVARCLDVAARAARLLGGITTVQSTNLEFPLRSADIAEADACRDECEIDSSPYAVLHTGAAIEERRWPTEKFAAVGRLLARHSIVPVLTGTEAERAIAEETADLIGPEARVVAGSLSLGGVAAMLAGARGVITNDTGISHLSAALDVPSVVVFTGSDPRRWAPLDTSLHHAVSSLGSYRTRGSSSARRSTPTVADTLAAVAAAGIAH